MTPRRFVALSVSALLLSSSMTAMAPAASAADPVTTWDCAGPVLWDSNGGRRTYTVPDGTTRLGIELINPPLEFTGAGSRVVAQLAVTPGDGIREGYLPGGPSGTADNSGLIVGTGGAEALTASFYAADGTSTLFAVAAGGGGSMITHTDPSASWTEAVKGGAAGLPNPTTNGGMNNGLPQEGGRGQDAPAGTTYAGGGGGGGGYVGGDGGTAQTETAAARPGGGGVSWVDPAVVSQAAYSAVTTQGPRRILVRSCTQTTLPAVELAGYTCSLPSVFNYSGAPQQFTVPEGDTVAIVELQGGQGGEIVQTGYSGYAGKGAKVTSYLRVTSGQALEVRVGGAGMSTGRYGGAEGGFNGGGSTMNEGGQAGGGGATDVRLPGGDESTRLAVAGGGGAAGALQARTLRKFYNDGSMGYTMSWAPPVFWEMATVPNQYVPYKGGDGGLVGEDGAGPYGGSGGTQTGVGVTGLFENVALGATAVGGKGSDGQGARFYQSTVDVATSTITINMVKNPDGTYAYADLSGTLAAGGGGYFGGGGAGARQPRELASFVPVQEPQGPWNDAWAASMFALRGGGGGGGGSSLAKSSAGLPEATVVKGARSGPGLATITTCRLIPVKDVTITKSASTPTRVSAGVVDVTYTVTATSAGTSNVDAPFTVTDQHNFGDGVTIVSTTATAGAGAAPVAAGFDGVAHTTLAAGTLAPGTSQTWTVTVRANVGATTSASAADCTLAAGEGGTGLRNVAGISGDGLTAASAVACQPVPAKASIDLVKTASAASVTTGTTVTYTFAVTNTGDNGLSGVAVTDPLPGLSAVSCPNAPAVLMPGATMSCTAAYTVTAADAATGSIVNTATARGTALGTAVTDTAQATVTVTAPTGDLPQTGSDSTLPILWLGLGLLALGAAGVTIRGRRHA